MEVEFENYFDGQIEQIKMEPDPPNNPNNWHAHDIPAGGLLK